MSPLPDDEEFEFGAGAYTFEMCEADIQNYDEEPCAVCFDEKFEIQGKIEYVISVSLCVFAPELTYLNLRFALQMRTCFLSQLHFSMGM